MAVLPALLVAQRPVLHKQVAGALAAPRKLLRACAQTDWQASRRQNVGALPRHRAATECRSPAAPGWAAEAPCRCR